MSLIIETKNKIGFLLISLVGMAFMIFSTYLVSQSAFTYLTSPLESWNQPYVHEWSGLGLILGFLFAIPGIILALIGGLIGRPRYLWIVMLIIGLSYCASVIITLSALDIRRHISPHILEFQGLFITTILSLPGIICILEGVLIPILRKRA